MALLRKRGTGLSRPVGAQIMQQLEIWRKVGNRTSAPCSPPGQKTSNRDTGHIGFQAVGPIWSRVRAEDRAMTDQTVSHLPTRTESSHRAWSPEFLAVAAFSAIGLLVMLNVMLRLPEVGAVLIQYGQF
jgi:hypothetical protein